MTFVNKWMALGFLGLIWALPAQAAQTCQTAGQADGLVLALSWQQNFCKSRPEKPECRSPDRSFFDSGALSLHGLWPNKAACGTKYGFCGTITRKPKNFCAYPTLDLDPEIRALLNQVMPSAKAGSCLQRHEWFKHGTCSQNWDQNGYFEQAIALTHQFNDPKLKNFLRQHQGKTVQITQLRQIFQTLWGKTGSQRIQLKCRKNSLSDIYVYLPVYHGSPPPLKRLLSTGTNRPTDTCKNSFRIEGGSPIG